MRTTTRVWEVTLSAAHTAAAFSHLNPDRYSFFSKQEERSNDRP